MKIQSNFNIRSYEDLKRVKKKLRDDIAGQEDEILHHPLISVPLALFESTSIKGSIQNSLESISLDNYKHALMSLIGTVMLANRRTRKFFIGFVIAKELVPIAVQKIGGMMKK